MRLRDMLRLIGVLPSAFDQAYAQACVHNAALDNERAVARSRRAAMRTCAYLRVNRDRGEQGGFAAGGR